MLYLTHKGLTIAQVGVYQMLLQGSMFAFEIPTGYIGDKIGKIKSLQTGTLLLMLHCILIIFFRHPAALILLGAVEGIGYTFVSGSDSALLYELLKTEHKEQDYLKQNANLQAIQSILIGVTISLGAMMLSFSWDSVYYMTAICLAVSLGALVCNERAGRSGGKAGRAQKRSLIQAQKHNPIPRSPAVCMLRGRFQLLRWDIRELLQL